MKQGTITLFDNTKLIFESVIPIPKFKSKSKKTGKITEQLCTLNNYQRWIRWNKTEIKNQYKQLLSDFFIPEPESEPRDKILLHYQVLRHNKRRIDSMNVIAFSDKWCLDLMVDIGHLIDDDKCTHIIEPAIYCDGLNETMLKLKVYSI